MRIWVARPEPGASRTADRLAALGHAPLVAPIFAVVATETAMPEGPFDGVVLTSGQGALRLADSGIGADQAVFAVGGRTADTARDAGIGHVESADGDAGDLVRLVRSRLPSRARLLHVAGEDRKAEPGASLLADGYRVSVWEAYAARQVAGLPAPVSVALAEGRLAAVLHYSRRGAATALQLAQSAGLDDAFRAIKHYCLSTDVALPLVEAGVLAHFVAARPTEEALLDGLPPSARAERAGD
jgi:uroporphyrinogen-III synthase